MACCIGIGEGAVACGDSYHCCPKGTTCSAGDGGPCWFGGSGGGCFCKSPDSIGIKSDDDDAETFIPAADPACWYTGRTRTNADGSRTFDWAGVQMWVALKHATYAKAVINASEGFLGRISVEANGFESTTFFVGGGNPQLEFLAARDLYGDTTLRAINILEPSFGAAPAGTTDVPFPVGSLTFLGWKTDGVAVLPPLKTAAAAVVGAVATTLEPRRTRKIELVGDSISSGYGSRGSSKMNRLHQCPVNDLTSGNKYTYNWAIAEAFGAEMSAIAWSGKGMYRNCCEGTYSKRWAVETMPLLWRRRLAGDPDSTDWDFAKDGAPDMLIINLGTNDFSHDTTPGTGANRTEFEAGFRASYVQFVLNATRLYRKPRLPVFIAQADGPLHSSPVWDRLHDTLQLIASDITTAGGNASFLDMRGPVFDGCGGHPGVGGHAAMAQLAIPQIARVMGWTLQ